MKPLTVVSAGQDARLQALLELALTGLPYEPVEIGAGPLPDLSLSLIHISEPTRH